MQYLARENATPSAVVAGAPRYRIVKAKSPRGADLDALYAKVVERFKEAHADRRDGLRLAWADRWLHVRPSGTEPIIRYIAEAPNESAAKALIATCQELV